MKILSSEISKGSPNPRVRRTSGLRGGVVTFQTDKPVFNGDIFTLHFDGKDRYYKVEEISTIDKTHVEVAATEYGYIRSRLSREPKFDVRSLLDLELTQVTDKEKIRQITMSASLC